MLGRQEVSMTLENVVEEFHLLDSGNHGGFAAMAEVVLRFQRARNPVVAAWSASRYLPVDAFRHAPVCTFDPEEAEAVFLSSGTGGSSTDTAGIGSGTRSRHYVRDLSIYHRSIDAGFTRVFGQGPFTFLAHLPEYESLGVQSSLVVMARRIAAAFGNESSGLFLNDDAFFRAGIAHAVDSGEPLILLGAAFGLLDLIDTGRAMSLPPGSVVIETGGMKTHRRSIRRDELHQRLAAGFDVPDDDVRSEYGMCELLSQCWTAEDGLFRAPPWMSVEIVRKDAPDETCEDGEEGVIAVVDLANVYSASALVTQDIGVRHGAGFEVLGRLDTAELRGCNFLFE